MDVNIGGTLKAGDLLLIPQNKYTLLGIFIGEGKSGSCQYYNLNTINWMLEQPQVVVHKKRYQKQSVWAAYVKAGVVKINPSTLTNTRDIELYHKGLELLKERKIIR